MSLDSGGAEPGDEDPIAAAGLEIAMKWGAALGGPEQLKVALDALEPQLKREHQFRLRRLAAQGQAADREVRMELVRRQYRLRTVSLLVGAAMSVAMLGAGVYVAKDVWWLAMLLCGPSLIAILKIIVLRRSDQGDMAAVSAAARSATSAAFQAQPPV